MISALKTENLGKTYTTNKHSLVALKNVNLEISKGDFFALLGANGAGKTTIINIITSLTNKTKGKIWVFDQDTDVHPTQAKKKIGVVPQEFNFNIFEKVGDIVLTQAGYYGIPRAKALPRTNQLLEKLGLADKKNSRAGSLSGGMKRRLMIARALVHNPSLLILDEPTAGVDVELRISMWEYLKELNQKENLTILLTTHYLEEVEQLCNKAAIIKEGEIIKLDLVGNLLKSLPEERFLIEVKDCSHLPDKIQAGSYVLHKVPNSDCLLEVGLKTQEPVNNLIHELDKKKLEILDIRPKGSRFEELFLNILKK